MQFRHGRICQIDKGQPIGELQSRFKTLGEALLNAVFDDDAVNHNFDVMLIFLVERGRFFNGVHFAVNADAGVARALPLGEFLAIFALAALNDWREQEGACAFGQGHDAVDHLAYGLRSDRKARRGRIRHAHARPQKPHIVVNLSHRGHRRARVSAGGFLFDGDGGGQPLNMLDIGLLHHFQKLAGVG